MGLSEFYGARQETSLSLARLHDAWSLGYRHFDTADMYGLGHNEELLGRFVAELGPRRHQLFLASKVGIVRDATAKYRLSVNGRPEYIAAACEATLRRLGTDHLDLYYLHRQDPTVPVAETIGALGELVRRGLVRAIGLCEVTAPTLRAAHATHPVAALQSEYSLWSRDVEAEILPACAELGIAFVAFSPLGRGFLTGALTSERLRDLDPAVDLRALLPRFSTENGDANLALVARFKALCGRLERTPAQVALSWILGRAATVHAIPGSTAHAHLTENFASLEAPLAPAVVAALDELFPPGVARGDRYPARSG
jgi:aryl-alcohol dehydrogenase-like predicted oxidoreductase